MGSMTCADAEPLLAAAADGRLDAGRQLTLDGHLAACPSCRAALDEQRQVAAILASEAHDEVSPGFVGLVNARIDEADSFFGVVDFRAWTLRLAPIAATLAVVAFLGVGARSASTTSATSESVAQSSAVFSPTNADDWNREVSSEALLEAALSRAGESNAR